MATVIEQMEAQPASYPDAPSGLSAAAAALDKAVVWQRIESFTALRFGTRAVIWIVEGPGEWHIPLIPVSPTVTKEVWSRGAEAWETATLSPSPLGGVYLPCTGPYRFTAEVGYATVSIATINEAFRRAAEYMAAKPGKPGASSESVAAGSITVSHRRSESWMASALQNSGAADLLRAYRKV
jgi:hypothetical protein